MDLKTDNIWDILIAHLCEERIQDSDLKKLNQWLENEENRQIFAKLKQYYKEQSVRKKINEDKAFQIIFNQIHQKQRQKRLKLSRSWSSVASIIVISLVTILIISKTDIYQTIPKAGSEKNNFENTGITLQLADGQEILLEKEEKLCLPYNDVTINNQNGILSFTPHNCLENTGEKYNLLKIPRGREYQMILPDSTRVWLNTASQLKFPLTFGQKERRVFLEGEAYFEVKKATNLPFIVETDQITVEVLGTSFDLKAYKDERNIYTTLINGAVRIIPEKEQNREIELKPSQQYILNRKSMQQEIVDVNPSIHIAWINHMFAFWNQRLEDVMNDLTQWYGVEFVFKDKLSADMRISGNIERSRDLAAILDMIMNLKKVKIDKQDEKYVIQSK